MTPFKRSQLPSLAAALSLTIAALVMPGTPLFAENAPDTPASRIVAVGGSVTEVVFALGQQDRLIARDSTSIYPEEANALPDVGYIRALSPEGMMSVDPDLVLMLDGSGPPEAVDVLRKSGIAIADIPEDFSAEGIVEKVRAIGKALGVPEKAEELALEVEADLADARSKAASTADGVRVLFILSTRGGSILASGSETAADGIIALAGAENAVSEFAGYKQLSEEAIISAAPDVILMMDRGGDHGATADELFSHPAIAQTPAGKNRQLIKMPGEYLLGFGPRSASAVRDLVTHLAAFRS